MKRDKHQKNAKLSETAGRKKNARKGEREAKREKNGERREKETKKKLGHEFI